MKYRLKCIHRFSKDPSKRQEFSAGTAGAETRDLLMSELRVLTASLRRALEEYEHTYNEQFIFRGVWYLDAMSSDEAKMPEMQAAWNANAHKGLTEAAKFAALTGTSPTSLSLSIPGGLAPELSSPLANTK